VSKRLPHATGIVEGWVFQAAFSRNLNLPALAGSWSFYIFQASAAPTKA
jgi:hypothetical protein